MRHVIVEGPDGGGKSRLIERLTEALGLEVGPRASNSTGGPVMNLREWTADNLTRWMTDTTANIYDRYPIISEPIYGPIVRGGCRPGFTPPWVSTCRLMMYPRCVVVWCLPPMEVVGTNVRDTAECQMPGVVRNISAIYRGYEAVARAWPGLAYRWDYRVSDFATLVIQLKGAIR